MLSGDAAILLRLGRKVILLLLVGVASCADGHIGYRGGGTELGGVARYLARWLPRRREPD